MEKVNALSLASGFLRCQSCSGAVDGRGPCDALHYHRRVGLDFGLGGDVGLYSLNLPDGWTSSGDDYPRSLYRDFCYGHLCAEMAGHGDRHPQCS
jgi:hypothetical protein